MTNLVPFWYQSGTILVPVWYSSGTSLEPSGCQSSANLVPSISSCVKLCEITVILRNGYTRSVQFMLMIDSQVEAARRGAQKHAPKGLWTLKRIRQCVCIAYRTSCWTLSARGAPCYTGSSASRCHKDTVPEMLQGPFARVR